MIPSTASRACHLQQLLLLRRAAASASAAATPTTTATTASSSARAWASASASPARPGILDAPPASALRQYRAAGPSTKEDEGREQQPKQQQWRRPSSVPSADHRPRCFSTSEPQQQQEEDESVVVYRGALGPSLRRLKLVSLTNTAVALAASPALRWLADNAPDSGAAYASAATVATAAAGFGVLTTVGLHWFTKPYVHEIVRVGIVAGGSEQHQQEDNDKQPLQPSYRLRALSPLGRAVWRPLDVSAVRPADVARPLATFAEGGRVYYVDAAGFAEDEDALREALMPLSAAEAAAVAAQAEAADEAAAAAAAAVEEEQERQQQQEPHREADGAEKR